MDIVKRFENFIEGNRLIQQNDRILVALSGGADSVMLLHLLLAVKENYDLTVEAFHLNHQLRTQASADEAFVKNLCEKKEILCHIHHSDIYEIAQKNSVSLEEAGRTERYRLMDEIMKNRGLNKAATAHHLDDNAETVIMRLIRGTGIIGLEGIPISRNDTIIRPLMFLTKEEILNYLNGHQIEFVTDKSNFDRNYLRNRVRMDILPLLKKENGKIEQSIMRLSEIARLNHDMLEYYADQIPVLSRNGAYTVSYKDIAAAHDMVRQHVFKKLAELNGISKNIDYGHIQNLIKLIDDAAHTTWDYMLPGIIFKRRYDVLTAQIKCGEENSQAFFYKIGANGIYIFSKEKFIIKMTKVKKIEKNHDNPYIKTVDYDKIKHSLVVRNKQEGDFFYPLNLGGRKSLKKLFIDKKIYKEKRPRIPILCDGENIVCILGFDIDDRYKITCDTQNYLLIEYLAMENNYA